MKRIKVLVLCLVLTISCIFTGCGFDIGTQTQQYSDVDIFEEVQNMKYSMKPKSITTSNKGNDYTYTMTFELKNKSNNEIEFKFDRFNGFDKDNDKLTELDFDYDKSLTIEDGDKAEWTVTITGDDAKDIDSYKFEMDDGEYLLDVEIEQFKDGFKSWVQAQDEPSVQEEITTEEKTEESTTETTTEEITTEEPTTESFIDTSSDEDKNAKYKTAYGSDLVGYVDLPESVTGQTWVDYKDVDVTSTDAIKQYASTEGNLTHIVTLSAIDKTQSSKDIMASLIAKDEGDETLEESKSDDYGNVESVYVTTYAARYNDNTTRTLLSVSLIESKYLNKIYFISYEIQGPTNDESWSSAASKFSSNLQTILQSYSPLVYLTNMDVEDYTDINNNNNNNNNNNSNNNSNNSISTDGKTYTLYNFNDTPICTLTIPTGAEIDEEFTDENAFVFDYNNVSIYVSTYADEPFMTFVENGSYDLASDKSYSKNYKQYDITKLQEFKTTDNGTLYIFKVVKSGKDSSYTSHSFQAVYTKNGEYSSFNGYDDDISESDFTNLAKTLYNAQ